MFRFGTRRKNEVREEVIELHEHPAEVQLEAQPGDVAPRPPPHHIVRAFLLFDNERLDRSLERHHITGWYSPLSRMSFANQFLL
jgi:hypothetical protein